MRTGSPTSIAAKYRVTGNERADRLAGDATVAEETQPTLDPASIIDMVKLWLDEDTENTQPSSTTLDWVKGKGVQKGDGARSTRRGPERRMYNQLLCNTVSIRTLRWSLARRAEQIWTCPSCDDVNP